MPKYSRSESAKPDYQVGYGRPPAATRFAPGKSGNPRGRPCNAGRQRRDGDQNDLNIQHQAILDAAQRIVEVKRGGKHVKVSAYAAVIESLVDAARHGNPRAVDMFLKMHREAEEYSHKQSLNSSDGVELTKYLARLIRNDGIAVRENEILKARIAELEGATCANVVQSEREVESAAEFNLPTDLDSPVFVQPADEPDLSSVLEIDRTDLGAPVASNPFPTALRRPGDPLIRDRGPVWGGGYGIN